jgi:hypothetical protein
MSQPAAAADKQTALVEAISANVASKLAESLAKLTVSVNSILARIETMEAANAIKAGGESGVAAKRAVRTGTVAKGGKKAGGAKKSAGDDGSRVTNALLYLRYGMANDLFGWREHYCTEEVLAGAESDPVVAKKDRAQDESGYFSAVGQYIWKKFSDQQKEEMRVQFVAWKEQTARDEAEPQLEEDDAENE